MTSPAFRLTRHFPWLVALALVAGLVMVGGPSGAQELEQERAENESQLGETRERLDTTNAELSDITERLGELEADLEAAEARLAVLDQEIEVLQGQVATAQQEMFDLQERVDDALARIESRVRGTYMYGQSSPVLEMFSATTTESAIDRAEVANRIADIDQAEVEQAHADQARLDLAIEEVRLRQGELVLRQQDAIDLREQMAADVAEASELRDELRRRVDDLEGDEQALEAEIARIDKAIEERKAREAAAAEAARKAEEAAREAAEKAAEEAAEEAARASSASSRSSDSSGSSSSSGSSGSSAPAPSSSGRVCPMNSIPTLFNDWGWPRGGNRTHKGNDLYGDYREPVYAIVSGTWDVQSYGSSAGHWAILKGDDGNHYWYLHLDGHAVGDGARVSKGQHVAYNGWSGNAVGSVYHIHFEVHPGGGGPVDPYPYLRNIC